MITRVLVRTVLSRYCRIPAEEWSFAPNPYGRPEVTNSGIEPEGIRFNVSHTGTLIMLGVTRGRDLGVDVEDVSKALSPVEIAQRFFSARERDDLQRCDGEAQKQRFFEYWTLKEAYVKARGMGLSIPLDKFSFHLPPGRIAMTFDQSLSDSAAAWRLWLLRPSLQHIAAICVRRGPESTQRVSMREIIPLIGEHILHGSIVRTSD